MEECDKPKTQHRDMICQNQCRIKYAHDDFKKSASILIGNIAKFGWPAPD